MFLRHPDTMLGLMFNGNPLTRPNDAGDYVISAPVSGPAFRAVLEFYKCAQRYVTFFLSYLLLIFTFAQMRADSVPYQCVGGGAARGLQLLSSSLYAQEHFLVGVLCFVTFKHVLTPPASDNMARLLTELSNKGAAGQFAEFLDVCMMPAFARCAQVRATPFFWIKP
jgi:hypothetical protein